MNYIPTNTPIRVEWTVKKGIGNVVEDFSRSEVYLFLESDKDRWAVSCEKSNLGITADLPQDLEEGVYHLELIWYKNEDQFRSIQRTKKECVFAIDKNIVVEKDKCVVRIESVASAYGYDGLSAYELAVIGGYTSGMTQNEWSRILYGYQESEADRVAAENTRNDNEADRQDNERTRIENEAERESSESLRMEAEGTRNDNEADRQDNERTRIENEAERESSESLRMEAEQTREQNETTRLENESARHVSERDRKVNEADRQDNERTRIENEAERESMESLRMEAEQTREQNEEIRQAQEKARQARVVQTTGEDESLVMSQKAVTDEIIRITDEIADEFTRVDKNQMDFETRTSNNIHNLRKDINNEIERIDRDTDALEEAIVTYGATVQKDLYPTVITEAQQEAMENAGTWDRFTKEHNLIYVYEE